MSAFFLFSDSGLNLLNGFDFSILIYFEWRDTENQQLLGLGSVMLTSLFSLFHVTGECHEPNSLIRKRR